MRPFENDSEAVSIAGLSIENGIDMVAVHGNLEITRDQQSLKHIEALMSLLGDVKAKLMNLGELPDVAVSDVDSAKVDVVANPFGDN
jgi:hypothetical protein